MSMVPKGNEESDGGEFQVNSKSRLKRLGIQDPIYGVLCTISSQLAEILKELKLHRTA